MTGSTNAAHFSFGQKFSFGKPGVLNVSGAPLHAGAAPSYKTSVPRRRSRKTAGSS